MEHELLGEQPGTEAVAALGEGLPHDGRVHSGGGCLRLDEGGGLLLLVGGELLPGGLFAEEGGRCWSVVVRPLPAIFVGSGARMSGSVLVAAAALVLCRCGRVKDGDLGRSRLLVLGIAVVVEYQAVGGPGIGQDLGRVDDQLAPCQLFDVVGPALVMMMLDHRWDVYARVALALGWLAEFSATSDLRDANLGH